MNRNKGLLMRTWALISFLSLLFISVSIQAATVRYQHTDMLGSVVAESDALGNIISNSRSHYEPFGKRIGGDKEGIGYTGHLQDKDLGLTYMQARYYDPLIGRFYANDPIGFRDVHSFNRYAYANNNPYKYVDPDGRNSYNPQGLIITPEQNRALRNATTVSVGAAVGAKLGVKTPNTVASLGAEASMVVQNGSNGAENVTTLEAGAKLESNVADAKAQLFKVEEHSDSSTGTPKVTSLTVEGPKLGAELKSGSASVSSDNKVKVEATIGVVKVAVEVDLDKLK